MNKIFLTAALTASIFAYAYANSPYISKVYEYRPAPGQFINEMPEIEPDDSPETILAKAEEQICGDKIPGMITLGAFGGYVVFGFDHPVINLEGEYDFKIYGNAFITEAGTTGTSCEPGIVMVSADTNGNGIPDDPWYELAGSDYKKESTIRDFTITYHKPVADHTAVPGGSMITDSRYIRWTSANPLHSEGYIEKNRYHSQSYWPEWCDETTLTFTGTRLADNFIDVNGDGTFYATQKLDWGYVDNDPNADLKGFNIDWAVNADGTPKHLDRINFIKVYTAINQTCGGLGETSTEVAGGEDLHPEAQGSGIDTIDSENTLKVLRNGGTVIIRYAGEPTEAAIFTAAGIKVATLTLTEGTNTIDTSAFPATLLLLHTPTRTLKLPL